MAVDFTPNIVYSSVSYPKYSVNQNAKSTTFTPLININKDNSYLTYMNASNTDNGSKSGGNTICYA